MFGWSKKMTKQTGTESEMSMEEILDSIRQYVAEESAESAADPARLPHRDSIVVPPPSVPGQQRPAQRAQEAQVRAPAPARNTAYAQQGTGPSDDVLELTEQFATSRPLQPQPAQANMQSAKDAAGYAMSTAVDQAQSQNEVQQRSRNGYSQQPQSHAAQSTSPQNNGGGAASVAQDFSRLSNELRQQSSAQQQTTKPGVSGHTLEQLVQEMAQPMIRQWLEVNLPKITSKLVSEEIARMRQTGTN